MESVIKEKKLTDLEVWNIVKEWYTKMYGDILQDEEGNDLEEICEFNTMLIEK